MTDRAILMFVYDIQYDERAEQWRLEETHNHFTWEWNELLAKEWYVANGDGTSIFNRNGLDLIHTRYASWRWFIKDPASFPKLPLLLTTDANFRQIFHGIVSLKPSEIGAAVLSDEDDSFAYVLTGRGWHGVLSFTVKRPGMGILTAFSNQLNQLESGIEQVTFFGDDEVFGELII